MGCCKNDTTIKEKGFYARKLFAVFSDFNILRILSMMTKPTFFGRKIMRKVLLASTALVALGSISAHAADVTISGAYNFMYRMDSENTVDESTFANEGDLDIRFSNTTDSGLTTTLHMGADENSPLGQEDLNASLSGDFGTVYFDAVGDDVAIGGFDEKSNKAGEGTNATNDGALNSISASNGLMGTANLSVGFKLPSIVDGLTIAISAADTTANGEYFGYGVGYDLGMINIGYVKEANNTLENTYAGVGATFGDLSFGVDTSNLDAGAAANDRESTVYGVSYNLGDITLGYEMGAMDNGSGTELVNHKQIAASYTVAPGITAIFTNSEVDAATAGGLTDVDQNELQLKLAF